MVLIECSACFAAITGDHRRISLSLAKKAAAF
jgi:hypothetical protein